MILKSIVYVLIGSGSLTILSPAQRRSMDNHQPRLSVASSVKTVNVTPGLDAQGAIHADFDLTNVGQTDIIIYSATPSCGCAVVSFTHVLHALQNGTVDVSLDPQRLFAGKHVVQLSTNDPNRRNLELIIDVILTHAVSISPDDFISFGAVEAGGTPRHIKLKLTKPEFAPSVADVSSDSLVAALSRDTSDPTSYDLSARLTSGTTPGLFKASITIKTGISEEPEIVIPVSAIVVEHRTHKK